MLYPKVSNNNNFNTHTEAPPSEHNSINSLIQ